MASEWVTPIGYGTLGGFAFLLLPRLLLCLCGFTCCGVRRRSRASAWHSYLGNVEADTTFSCLQSYGAGGAPCGLSVGVFLFGMYLTVLLIVWNELSHAVVEPDLNMPMYVDLTTGFDSSTEDMVTVSM